MSLSDAVSHDDDDDDEDQKPTITSECDQDKTNKL